MIPPGMQAALDQEDAELGQHLDVLIDTYRRMCALPAGETQAAANIVRHVADDYGPVGAAGLLATAIRRLTAEGKQS